MAIIEGLSIKNYRSLQDVTLGKLWNLQRAKPLKPLTAVIGKNGSGKSTLFDAFGFLADCLKVGVEDACDLRGRGGFAHIRSQNVEGPIEFGIYYRQDGNARPVTYELSIDLDEDQRPYVKKERLRQRRKGQSSGRPFSFLILNEGKGWVWAGQEVGIREELEPGEDTSQLDVEESAETEAVELDDKRKLGIATLGALKRHPRIAAFRSFMESWYLSYFTPDAARSLPMAGPQKHLNVHGDNVGNVVQYMQREHEQRFKQVLNRIAEKIPGIDKIDTHRTADGRLLLRFYDRHFQDPFYAQQMSDGTLKVFAYLLLLEDPSPPPFICIEEPENGLYHKLMEGLAAEFRECATGKKGGSQIFITTHQPYFVDALDPEEVWVLEKDKGGFATIRRASDDPIVEKMVDEGLTLGSLWYSDYLDAR